MGNFFWKGLQAIPIDFDGDGSPENIDRNHETPCVLEGYNDAFSSSERTVFHTHSLPGFQKRPRFKIRVGLQDSADTIEIALLDRYEILSGANHGVHVWNHEHRQPVIRVEFAEDVTGKERKFYFFDPIGPAAGPLIQWEEFFVTFASKVPRYDFFKTRSYVKRVPE